MVTDLESTYPIPEQASHKPTAQFLPKAYNPVLRPRVDLELEALGSLEVLDEQLTFLLGLLPQPGIELGVADERVCSLNVILADVVDSSCRASSPGVPTMPRSFLNTSRSL
jgi:hypothetical protein